MAIVRLTQIDGKLPNLALMKLSHWHKSVGDDTRFYHQTIKFPDEPDYDVVYGSSIFSFSKSLVCRLQESFPGVVLGGTGVNLFNTVESIIGHEYEYYDYSMYPRYKFSVGFTARGCRLHCKFCVVPEKEGRPKSVNSIYDIWRGDPYPKNVVLLDNDFFGQPKEELSARVSEMVSGKFKVSFNQGINIRLIDDESAYLLSKLQYFDDQFKTRRLYTAWDNLRDESIFFRGVDLLEKHGVSPKHLFVYMLVGFDVSETMDSILYRFNRMVARGIRPYPMVYNNENKLLKEFQRWAVRRYYEFIPWNEFTKKNNFIIQSDNDLSNLLLSI